MNQIAPAHFWILHYALIDCQWLMVPSIGHAPWKDDTFLRNFQQTQACVTDELGENSLGLVTKHEVWSVFIEGLPVFLIMAPLWDKVYFPRGKGFSYGTNLQLRRAVLSPWFCLRWNKSASFGYRSWERFSAGLSPEPAHSQLREVTEWRKLPQQLNWIIKPHLKPLTFCVASSTTCPIRWGIFLFKLSLEAGVSP